jgi:hypothetical protein
VKIPPLPPEMGPTVREPNLTTRLLQLLSPSPQTVTKLSESATPVLPPTTKSGN